MQTNILQLDGDWLINTSYFAAFIDPTNGNRFEPGVVTKATKTDWVAGQPVIKACNELGEIAPETAEVTEATPTPDAPPEGAAKATLDPDAPPPLKGAAK